MQDTRSSYQSAVRHQIYCLSELNKAAFNRIKLAGHASHTILTLADADYESKLEAQREADAFVAYWRARLRARR